jgi:hypothetical protein
MNPSRAIDIVKRRMKHLCERIAESPDNSYDRAELSALTWMVTEVAKNVGQTRTYSGERDPIVAEFPEDVDGNKI